MQSGWAGSVREALLRKDVLLLSVQYFFWSLGVYGFVLWLPTIVRRGTVLSMGRTGLLSAIPYLAAILLMLLVSYISDKTERRESIVWPFLLTAGASSLRFVCLRGKELYSGLRLSRPGWRVHVRAVRSVLRH